jgi:RNA polymerase sigma-70 factor (ECF subfamily)
LLAFVLRNVREEETASICDQLGITSNHLWVILHRARNQLRASLRPDWLPAAHRVRQAASA